MIDKDREEKARELGKKIFEDHYGKKPKKANIWVCGYLKLVSTARKTKCKECKVICYYDTILKDFTKNAKKICGACLLEKHSDDLTEIERKLMEHERDKYFNSLGK